ncbi:hypothetical protein Slin15195_G125000 [Septoria linicola]|uniref:Uncharacterized protein n=1 Tax=Septoria linicola TaxID=215465 RepID=A0A9Q9B8U4_9PEZI|nr:hypothetical protein Slin14017_G081190 [Septoria linicola]USW59181.1 hypothetical protein Slin15195_G125000 [Septoria linicola]
MSATYRSYARAYLRWQVSFNDSGGKESVDMDRAQDREGVEQASVVETNDKNWRMAYPAW